jgi:hypothetical protein
MNLTVEDFNLFMEIGDVNIESVQVTKDVVGMKNRDYQKVLQHIVNYAVANFNFLRSEAPIDLKPASSYIPLLREVIKLKATPYIQDEFLFIGFESKINHTSPIKQYLRDNIIQESITQFNKFLFE